MHLTNVCDFEHLFAVYRFLRLDNAQKIDELCSVKVASYMEHGSLRVFFFIVSCAGSPLKSNTVLAPLHLNQMSGEVSLAATMLLNSSSTCPGPRLGASSK